MNNYVIYEETGKGPYSTVHKGRKKRSIEFVTLKSYSKHRKERILNEVKILSLLQHPHIVKFHNWYETRNHFWTIYEYLSGGDLKRVVELDVVMQEPMLKQIAKMLVEALMYMHSKGVIFCDFKLSNFVFDEYSNIKFVDFGSSRLAQEVVQEETNCNVNFMAPELFLENSVHSYKSDVWGFGVLLYTLAAGKSPFEDKDFESTAKNILNNEVEIFPGFSEDFNKLVKSLITKNPDERANWPDILKNKWFNNLDIKYVFKIEEAPNRSTAKATMQDVMRMSMKIQATEKEENNQGKKEVSPIHENSDSDVSGDELTDTQAKDYPCKPEKPVQGQGLIIEYFTQKEKEHLLLKIQKNLLFANADKQVYPIIYNNEIEVIEFEEMKPEINFFTKEQLENSENAKSQLSMIYQYLGSNAQAQKKIAVLCKLLSIIEVPNFANLITESYFFERLIKILKGAKTKNLRIILCTLIGSVLRYTTSTNANLLDIGIFDVCKELLENSNELVARRATAAFGEFLFYFATQNDETPDFKYQIPDWVFPMFTSILKTRKDAAQVNYILKTIENVTALSIKTGKTFANRDFIAVLANLLESSKNLISKTFALNILTNFCKIDENNCNALADKAVFDTVVACLKHKNSKLLTNALNLINIVLTVTKNEKKSIDDTAIANLSPRLAEILATETSLIKAKVLVFLKITVVLNINIQGTIFNPKHKMLAFIDKHGSELSSLKESVNKSVKGIESYMRKCLRSFMEFLLGFNAHMLEKLREILNVPASVDKNMHVLIQTLSYMNCLSSTESIKQYVFDAIIIRGVFNICESLIVLDNNSIQNYCLTLYEDILKSLELVNKPETLLAEDALPRIAQAIQKQKKEELKLVLFKIFVDIFNVCYDEEMEAPPAKITDLVFNFSLNLIDQKDQHINFYALKLLRTILERNLKEIEETDLVKLFEKIVNITNSNKKEMINANFFALVFYILANDSGLIFNVYKLDMMKISVEYLQDFGDCEQLEEIFGFLNLFFEIIHKLIKTKQLNQVLVFQSAHFKLIIQYMLANLAEFHEYNLEDGINIIYYTCMVILNSGSNGHIQILGSVNLNEFDFKPMIALKRMVEDKPAPLKKINRLQSRLKFT